ncbi:MAG: hypothetical protein ACKO7R_15155 [Pseudanabaena sp.]
MKVTSSPLMVRRSPTSRANPDNELNNGFAFGGELAPSALCSFWSEFSLSGADTFA